MRLLASQAVSSTPEAAASSTGRNDLHALIALALQVGGMAAATMRVHDMLVEVCRALPRAATGLARAVISTDVMPDYRPELPRRGGSVRRGVLIGAGSGADVVAVFMPACVHTMFGAAEVNTKMPSDVAGSPSLAASRPWPRPSA